MNTRDAWRTIAEHYKKLSVARASEEHLWVGTSGGPSLAMSRSPKHVVAAELTRLASDHQRSLS